MLQVRAVHALAHFGCLCPVCPVLTEGNLPILLLGNSEPLCRLQTSFLRVPAKVKKMMLFVALFLEAHGARELQG